MVEFTKVTMEITKIGERELPTAILITQEKFYHKQPLMRYHVPAREEVYKDVREVMHLNLTRQALYLWLLKPKLKELCKKPKVTEENEDKIEEGKGNR